MVKCTKFCERLLTTQLPAHIVIISANREIRSYLPPDRGSEYSMIKKYYMINQSTEGAEFVWVSECKKGAGCEIINQFVFV